MLLKNKGARLALILVLSLFLLNPAHSQETRTKESIFPKTSFLLGAGAAVLGAAALDDSAHNYFAEKKRIGELSQVGNSVAGNGGLGLVLGGGVWLTGYLSDRNYERHAGRAQMEAIVATGVLVTLAKSLSNRRRPNGEDSYAFPSAHTAYAFTTASVLNEFYGWKIGAPAYLLGALTAASRMQDNQHWLSDTVAGAAVGTIIGMTISRWHLRTLEKEKNKFIPEVSPEINLGQVGLRLKWEF